MSRIWSETGTIPLAKSQQEQQQPADGNVAAPTGPDETEVESGAVGRVVFFADAVIAIAATLLALGRV